MGGFHLMYGPTIRTRRSGINHVVVAHRGVAVWDPHPSRAGLIAVESWGVIAPRPSTMGDPRLPCICPECGGAGAADGGLDRVTKPAPRPAASFAALYPLLAAAVRPLGYALALHGSMARDLDLVAIPWAEDAKPAEDVVDAIKRAIEGWTEGDARPGLLRPHGRRSWIIWFRDGSGMTLADGHPYIDLSIMPRGSA